MPFRRFYTEHFLAEHRHPANVALHAAGTLANVRVLRKDFPGHWFIAANHLLTWRVLAGRK